MKRITSIWIFALALSLPLPLRLDAVEIFKSRLLGTWDAVSEFQEGEERKSTLIISEREGELTAVVVKDQDRITLDTITISGNRAVFENRNGITGIKFEAVETEPGTLIGNWSVHAKGDDSVRGKWRATGRAHVMALARSVAREADPLKQHGLVGDLLRRVTPENAKDISSIVFESPDALRGREWRGLFAHAWGRVDGRAAVEAAQSLKSSRLQAFFMGQAVSGWAISKPKAARAWIDDQEDSRSKMIHILGLISGLVVNDLEGATQYLEQLKTIDTLHQAGLRIIVDELLKSGHENAAKWASSLKDEELKASAFGKIGKAFANDDPATAAKWLQGHLREGYAKGLVAQTVEEWAEKDPEAAVDWILSQPASIQPEALNSAFAEWAKKDPATASKRLSELPEGKARDFAIAGFTSRIVREDPESAVDWAESISDVEVKKAAIVQAARYWHRVDAEAAKEWMEKSGLDEKTVESITSSQRGAVRGRPR